MLAYCKTLNEFHKDVMMNRIEREVVNSLNIDIGESERRSFRNSLLAISTALRNHDIPGDVDVALEYKIPLTCKRVDFMIAGADDEGRDHLVICELKQWDRVTKTDMDDVVKVGSRYMVHPSWQAYTYGATISNYNEYVEKGDVRIDACTFLHNYDREYIDELTDPIYAEGLKKAEPFIQDQYEELSEFVFSKIRKKSKANLLFEIENGHIRPSRCLVDCVANLLNGNDDFQLIDQQRIVFSNLVRGIEKTFVRDDHDKHVIIVRGGAGTGKSLIALKMISRLMEDRRLNVRYVAKSSYVKENYYRKLTRGVPDHMFLKTLFMGSSSFIDSPKNAYDVLIVDEAHRLTERSKQSWFYKGENQIKEIINASRASVFFIDETQNIDIKDFGTIENITKAAEGLGAVVHCDDHYVLESQFRCNGSDDYIAWLESVLYNREYDSSGMKVDYDIRIVDTPEEMKQFIIDRNNDSDTPSRMISGDVFDWKSRTDRDAVDIVIGGFEAQWNRTKYFASDPGSIDQVGCIHTTQGMEFEYAGLIVADDLLYRDGKVVTDYTVHPSGATEFKRPHKNKVLPEDAGIVDRLIRNTYKVLFTRGQKGCRLYVMDEQLKQYLKKRIEELLR